MRRQSQQQADQRLQQEQQQRQLEQQRQTQCSRPLAGLVIPLARGGHDLGLLGGAALHHGLQRL